jgi:flagellar hook-associated protein 3 FlgL
MIDTTNSMLYHIDNLNRKNESVTTQMATGKAINKGSEDSLLHSDLINLEDDLRVSENLKDIVVKSQVLNTTSDSSMAEMKMALDGIKTDLLKGLNAGMDRSDKLALATNLRGIRDNMYDLATTEVNGEYVFSGSNSTVKTMEKDKDFELNGQIDFKGDGFLRKVAVQPGSYRDRGITAYDVTFYTSSQARAGESFTFSEDESIIDENGHEWKLNSAKDKLQQYDHNGLLYDPVVEIAISSSTAAVEATGDDQAVKATYTIDNVGDTPASRVFEAKHNYFDDLNIIINALEGHSTQLDGTKGGVVSDESVRKTLSNGLELTSKQFDATNIGHGELGGRNHVFDIAETKLDTQITHYNILLQDHGGADLAKLSMESKALEITYQSLYTTISKMNNMSLVNFIK